MLIDGSWSGRQFFPGYEVDTALFDAKRMYGLIAEASDGMDERVHRLLVEDNIAIREYDLESL